MRRVVMAAGILAIGLIAATWFGAQPGKQTGFPAPDFALPDLTGKVERLSEFRGRVVFLNVWATWCPPCRMEMPSMEQLHRRFNGQDFVMLAVSQDEEGSAPVRTFANELGLTFPILLDPNGEVSRRYGVTGYPETFVIDRQGRVIQHVIGPEDWNSPESLQYFTKLLQHDAGPQQAGTDQRSVGG